MRPLRLISAIIASLLTVFLLSFFAARHSSHSTGRHDRSIRTLFDWRSPSSLFPPSAIISLTDDNSTFFLARPANFGPLLPTKGFSGQLWIGSGFGDDDLARGGVSRAEGELGCSDVPGWNEGDHRGSSNKAGDADKKTKIAGDEVTDPNSPLSPLRRRAVPEAVSEPQPISPSSEDGTDDHLHHPLQSSEDTKSKSGDTKKQSHADIQSIQESAEIAGKIVLLSRGGCGFLEKVKWVQRRGGTALIVGDNIRGGPLVTMYARGDTSNVTIPALFTSHTTAHLLSSLMPFGTSFEDISVEDVKRLGISSASDRSKQSKPDTGVRSSIGTESKVDSEEEGTAAERDGSSGSETNAPTRGWFSSLFSSSSTFPDRDNRRPPSSGHAGWVMEKDFDESIGKPAKSIEKSGNAKGAVSGSTPSKDNSRSSGDGFVIGVQDWRDPDLVETRPEAEAVGGTSTTSTTRPSGDQPTNQASPRGGSITPGSGEYAKHVVSRKPRLDQSKAKVVSDSQNSVVSGSVRKTSQKKDAKSQAPKTDKGTTKEPDLTKAKSESDGKQKARQQDGDRKLHDGLWITLSPTTMSSSPFFDTLLVLVVSPLVTLTVVYALLLLRSRIRRRRWRAPKSVVERLPVRTYHTIASSTATTSSAQPSPPGTPQTPNSTTPLLHSNARSIGPRPRSRTASEVPVAGSSFARSTPLTTSLDQIQEKKEAGLLEWKRKYGGKQRECVVCLEEYVDGVSRVMSLPCGHEFHAECITPWLTTRRRTCPICKGDVVRSLARTAGTTPSSNNEPRYESYDENDDEPLDGVQRQAADSRNDDPAAAAPMSRDDEAFEDLERGVPDRDR